MTAAPAAWAHDFTIVLVSTPSTQSGDAGRGFELAIDESPDVSHPSGPAAGDHLGGVDVTLVALRDGERDDAVERVGDLLDAGATAVVVLFVSSTADAIATAAAARDKLALVVAEGGRTSRGSLLLRPRPARDIDQVGVAAATSAFQGAFGVEPTRAALLGYDAGRLLDRLVTQVGHALRPREPLKAAALAAEAVLTSSSVLGAAERADTADTGGGKTTGPSGVRLVMAAAAAALGAAGAVALARRHRKP